MKGCDSSFQGAEYFWPEENCFLVTTRDLEHHLQKKTSSSGQSEVFSLRLRWNKHKVGAVQYGF